MPRSKKRSPEKLPYEQQPEMLRELTELSKDESLSEFDRLKREEEISNKFKSKNGLNQTNSFLDTQPGANNFLKRTGIRKEENRNINYGVTDFSGDKLSSIGRGAVRNATFGLSEYLPDFVKDTYDYLTRDAENYLKKDEPYLTEEEFNNHPDKLPELKYNQYYTSSSLTNLRERSDSREKFEYDYNKVSWGDPLWLASQAGAFVASGFGTASVVGTGLKTAGQIAGKTAVGRSIGKAIGAALPANTLARTSALAVADMITNVGLSFSALGYEKAVKSEEGKDVSGVSYNWMNAAADLFLPIGFRGFGHYFSIKKLNKALGDNDVATAAKIVENEKANQDVAMDSTDVKDSVVQARRDGLLRDAAIKGDVDVNAEMPKTGLKSNEIRMDDGSTAQLPDVINFTNEKGVTSRFGVDYRIVEASSIKASKKKTNSVTENAKAAEEPSTSKSIDIDPMNPDGDKNIPFLNRNNRSKNGNDLLDTLSANPELHNDYRKMLENLGYDTTGFEAPVLVREESPRNLKFAQNMEKLTNEHEHNLLKKADLKEGEEFFNFSDDVINSLPKKGQDLLQEHIATLDASAVRAKSISKNLTNFIACNFK